MGDVVLAIGNPFGVGQTVTHAASSRRSGRNNLHINHFENFIQTDAAINFGNSGGALVDTRGNLLGINSAIYSQTGGSVGIGFAIPVSTAKTVLEAIIKHGQVVRGWIGVESQDITPELADSFGLARDSGAIIAGVVRGGPADRAGMRPGDILLAVRRQESEQHQRHDEPHRRPAARRQGADDGDAQESRDDDRRHRRPAVRARPLESLDDPCTCVT